jgi:hypothetical protein
VTAETPDDVTIRFNHQKHFAAGVPCLFCHPDAINGAVATVPSSRKCVGCHQNIAVTSQAGQATVDQLLQSWEEGRPLGWPKIVDLPDFVHSNHRPHLAAGKNCEYCHGDVSQTPEEELPGENLWFASTCRQCSAGCGIIVRTSNGRAQG